MLQVLHCPLIVIQRIELNLQNIGHLVKTAHFNLESNLNQVLTPGNYLDKSLQFSCRLLQHGAPPLEPQANWQRQVLRLLSKAEEWGQISPPETKSFKGLGPQQKRFY
ncbi:uncharacterized protein LOC117661478 isoform X2 [Pantherophis guttatus]|uniref:Uncharacterized protein LOC117661478 isoform X2 n=1 Tax=Pantherophis guttatus TaxID=94885 RepID=A0A6P9B5F6_PANGU|nr:uncharacterized protein LOC117661478 isoform X2 [Pantherophis guttatus]